MKKEIESKKDTENYSESGPKVLTAMLEIFK